jgi:hypothetical protein
MSHHNPDRELAMCSDCGKQFDRSVQYYYGAKCPECVPDERLKRSCAICGDREMPGDLRGAMSRGRGPTERVQVCSEGCKAHAETKPWSPTPIRLLKGENKFASDGG